tara:strand:+ start:1682 stop:1966 length:285 start_codon:yes stop_codon:yes gene_type:complete
MEKKTIWLCSYRVRVWKEVYHNKSKGTKLSHLYSDYPVEGLLKGNCIKDLMDRDLNQYAYDNLILKFSGKYSAKLDVIGEIKRLSSHGLTNYEV